jgi:hypothetical protein
MIGYRRQVSVTSSRTAGHGAMQQAALNIAEPAKLKQPFANP